MHMDYVHCNSMNNNLVKRFIDWLMQVSIHASGLEVIPRMTHGAIRCAIAPYVDLMSLVMTSDGSTAQYAALLRPT